tara:strand:- start:441 stop:599 length:159 start_codon:yes stop_codon:yes gene_type:complete
MKTKTEKSKWFSDNVIVMVPDSWDDKKKDQMESAIERRFIDGDDASQTGDVK